MPTAQLVADQARTQPEQLDLARVNLQVTEPSKGGQNAFAPAMPIILQDSAKHASASLLLKATSEIIPGVGALKI
jgi:hypothetical protein